MGQTAFLKLDGVDDVKQAASIGKHGRQVTLERCELLLEDTDDDQGDVGVRLARTKL